jgi:hypothetical protein
MTDKVVVNNNGCGSGCLTMFAVLAVVRLAYEYWYVTVLRAAPGASRRVAVDGRRNPHRFWVPLRWS